jgi:hypothetical protein
MQNLMLSVSDDGGATWSVMPPVVLGSAASDVLPVPGVEGVYNYFLSVAWGQHGELDVGYLGYCAPPPRFHPDCIQFATSPDGGATWTTGLVVGHNVDPDRPGSRHIQEDYVAMAVDRSGGAHDGRVYVAYMDMATGDYDVLLRWTDDAGAHWSAARRLSTDAAGNGADQFHHGIAVDGHGVVHAVFWDRRADPQNLLVQAVHATWDPATGLLTNTFLEDPWDPDPGHVGQFLGDYNTADAAAGKVGLAWNVATPQKPGTKNTNIPWDLDVHALVIDA